MVEVGQHANPAHPKFGSVRAFDAYSFKFPSCRTCNEKYSAFEGRAKEIVMKILIPDATVSFAEYDHLLDWFDKIRIGLWLAYAYLDVGRLPHLFIDHRIGKKDRVLGIIMTDKPFSGFNYSSAQSPVFRHFPCCFFLRIAHVIFVNASYDFLVAKRVGFPHPKHIVQLNNGGDIRYSGMHISEPENPVFSFPYLDEGKWVAQVIAPSYEISPYWNQTIKRHGFIHSMDLDSKNPKYNPIIFGSNRQDWLTMQSIRRQMTIVSPPAGLNHFMDELNLKVAEYQLLAWKDYHRYSLLRTKGYINAVRGSFQICRAQSRMIKRLRHQIQNVA